MDLLPLLDLRHAMGAPAGALPRIRLPPRGAGRGCAHMPLGAATDDGRAGALDSGILARTDLDRPPRLRHGALSNDGVRTGLLPLTTLPPLSPWGLQKK